MGRTGELILGIMGGIFGIFSGIFAMTFGGIGVAIGGDGASSIVGLGFAAIIFSITGLVGSTITKGKRKVGGWMMIGSAIAGTISISAFFILPGLLLLIGGIMALMIKEDKK